MEPSDSFETLTNVSPLLVSVMNPTSSEPRSSQVCNEIASLDTTTAQVPLNVEVYHFRQSDASKVHTTTENIKDTQNVGAMLIDLMIDPCGRDWKSIL